MQIGMNTNVMKQESAPVPGWEQALARAEEMLGANADTKMVLAQQIFQHQQMEGRIQALEGIMLCQKEILNFDEAAAYLSMSKSTLYKLTSKKEIPHYKPNRFVFFERAALDGWIRDAAVKTEEELNDEAIKYCYNKAARV
jgi:excisionase family DNA binding protein